MSEPDTDDALKALNKTIGDDPVCPCCGETVWNPVIDGLFRLVAYTFDDAQPKGIPVLALSCARCGFLRLHTRASPST